MDITRDQQIRLDDALVAPAKRLKIGKSNLRLSLDLNSKEATLQVVYDVLKLTPFYKAFQITANVPEIYMQEFWATTTVHHHSIRFKMNNKKHIVNHEYFREMLQICLKLPDQQFEELPFEEEIFTFLKDLGHSGEIKVIIDVNVNKLHQPWRSFAAVINKYLSGKSIGYDSLRLSQAQILWCMYHKKNVDYAYLLWEDFVYQVENKNVKKSNEMYYPRFTKVVVNFFMTKDQSIPRRNNVNWHYVRDDYMFTTIKVVSRHEDTQLYGAILPDELTNEAIKDSESYKEYYAIASGAEPPKTKASVKKKQATSDITKNPSIDKGKRLKTSAKAAKPAKKKQPAKTYTDKGADEGTGAIPGVPDVPTYNSDDEQISWKSSDEDDDNEDDDANDDAQDKDDQDNDNEQTDSDNKGDDFVHPKFSTHDEEERKEESFDPRVQTPSHVESTDDESNEESDEEVQGANSEDKEMDEEATHEDDEANELYREVNVNLEGRDIVMTDAPLPTVQETQEIEDTHVIITALITPKAKILWGMYHKKNVDYTYLLWEDFVYQVENKNGQMRSNEIVTTPASTRSPVNFFDGTKGFSQIQRRNRVNWHCARDDPMFTTIKVLSRHKDTHVYGAILPDELTNEAIKYSESYKEYYAIASGAEPPKTKASVKKKQTGSDKTKTPPTAKGKRLKTSAKAAKPAKKKQPAKTSKAKGLTVLSEVTLSKAEQMELATKRSLIQTHSSHASNSGTDEGTGDIPGVPDVPTYVYDDEQISWKSSDEEDDDEVAMSGDDGDDANNQDDDDNDDDDQNDDNPDNENDDNNDDDNDGQDHEGQDDDNEYVDEESNSMCGNVELRELDEEETNE
ncbi:hypothetical protein Tco_0639431 [Tanacetum coccineum]